MGTIEETFLDDLYVFEETGNIDLGGPLTLDTEKLIQYDELGETA